MIKTSYQVPELRNANDEVVQEGAFGKNTALSNSTNDGWIDYVMNDLEALHDTIGDSAATLDGNGHVVEPANYAIGDEDGNRLKTSYLKLTGGTVAGTVNIAQNLKMQDNQENVFGGLYVPASSASEQYLSLYGGESPASGEYGARLRLYGVGDGKFQLVAQKADGSTSYTLTCTDAGNLTWRGNTLATLASPAFTGNPTAPTQAITNNSTRLATTAHVSNKLKACVPVISGNTDDNLITTLTSTDDLDNVTAVGTYYWSSSSVPANAPVTTSSKMYVIQSAGSSYRVQLVFMHTGSIRVRYSGNTGSTWGNWRSFAYEDAMLPLTGGTLSAPVTIQTVNPASYGKAYNTKYTGITDGVAPSGNRNGYLVQMFDADDSSLGGIYVRIEPAGALAIQMVANWNASSRSVRLHYNGTDSYFAPTTNNAINLGNTSMLWKQLFAGTTTISTSDERLKGNITAIPDEVLDAWGEVGWYQYQFNDSIAEKGESRARIHTGAIAQRIESVFTAHGLDANRYGLLCYDEWNATPAERDENGNITEPAKPAGNRYSLRYEEALCMEAAYQRRRADRLEERIARLEALVINE